MKREKINPQFLSQRRKGRGGEEGMVRKEPWDRGNW